MRFSILLVLVIGNTVCQTLLALVGVPGSAVTALIALFSGIAILDSFVGQRIVLSAAQIALLVALPFLSLMSLGWSLDPDTGLSKLIVFAGRAILPALGLAIGVAAFGGWEQAKRRVPKYVRFLLMSILAATVVFGEATRFIDRLEVGGSNPIWLGRSVVMLTVLLVALEGDDVTTSRRWFDLAAAFATLLLIGSRGPIAGYLVFLIWFFLLRTESTKAASSSSRNRQVIASALLVFLTTLIGFGLVPLGRFETVFGAARDNSSSFRVNNLQAAWDQFLQRPLSGAGIGGFQGASEGAYPHNLVAEIAVELGIVGLAILALLLRAVLLRGYAEPAVKAGVVVGLCVALFSGDIGGNEGMWLFAGLALGQTAHRRAQLAGKSEHLHARPATPLAPR